VFPAVSAYYAAPLAPELGLPLACYSTSSSVREYPAPDDAIELFAISQDEGLLRVESSPRKTPVRSFSDLKLAPWRRRSMFSVSICELRGV